MAINPPRHCLERPLPPPRGCRWSTASTGGSSTPTPVPGTGTAGSPRTRCFARSIRGAPVAPGRIRPTRTITVDTTRRDLGLSDTGTGNIPRRSDQRTPPGQHPGLSVTPTTSCANSFTPGDSTTGSPHPKTGRATIPRAAESMWRACRWLLRSESRSRCRKPIKVPRAVRPAPPVSRAPWQLIPRLTRGCRPGLFQSTRGCRVDRLIMRRVSVADLSGAWCRRRGLTRVGARSRGRGAEFRRRGHIPHLPALPRGETAAGWRPRVHHGEAVGACNHFGDSGYPLPCAGVRCPGAAETAAGLARDQCGFGTGDGPGSCRVMKS